MKLELLRVAYTGHGTFGVLSEVRTQDAERRTRNLESSKLERQEPFAVTLERPWLENQASAGAAPGSCIPEGSYRCLRCCKSPDYGFRHSPKFGDTFQVYQVPGRSWILFHKGNLEDDTRGCILVGEQFARIARDGELRPGIAASAAGFAEFLRRAQDVDEFALEIRSR